MIPLEYFEGQSSDGQFVPIVAGGSSVPLTFSNRRAYVDCAIQFRLHEMDLQVGCLNKLLDSLYSLSLIFSEYSLLYISVCWFAFLFSCYVIT